MYRRLFQHVSVYYQNCRGLRTKLVCFYFSVCDCYWDFAFFSETWLSDDVSDGELFFPN